MRCSTCHHENRDGRKFCVECGATLALSCAACGAPYAADEKFCGECGASLATSHKLKAKSHNDPRLPILDIRSYTPKHLADKILQSKSALEGERKQVTVLFADVKGSMELAEQLDPEEWHRILDKFFAILTDGVHRCEGTVNQYTGDGIMALFGAPIAHEDHAQRACYAALYLRDEVRRYADELRLQQGLSFSTRMGLNSGEVVVGRIGDDLRMDYTAQGHVVGLAARMEQLAEPRSIYLTEHTAKLVTGYFQLRDLGSSRVKGVSEALQLYELEGLGALRTRLEVSRARGFSKFVGRADDMATLEAALTRALAGQGQVVGVVADAGTGKSRLCFEFLERCRARNIMVTEGRAVAHGKSIPFLPMLQVFRAYYGITEQDTDRTAREKIAGRLLLIDESFREVLPLLFEFFGVPDPEHPAPLMDPEARQRQLFGVLRRLVQQGNQQQLIVTLIEDLHWIDAGSEAFLAQWVDAIAPAHGLLLFNFRPEYRADWMRKSYYQQLPLLPLGPEAIDELFRDLLGSDASLAALTTRIRERTAGNPFFIEEVVQSLIETGALVGSRGAYRLTRSADTFAIPATVQAILAARIDRLPEREKQVLQTAAAIGKEFSEPLLLRVLFPPSNADAALASGSPPLKKEGQGGFVEMIQSKIPPDLPFSKGGTRSRSQDRQSLKGEEEVRAALRALTDAEFLYEQALYPVAEYSFKHPLTQEVAHGSQLAERRQRTHAAVARALEEGEASKLDEHAALIAHHWEAAGEALIAARWHARAAAWAANSDLAASHQHWQAVRELVSKLPEAGETGALRLSACVQLVNLGWRLATPRHETDAFFAEGQELAARAGDLRSQAMLFSNYSLTAIQDDVPKALECYFEANRLADRTGDLALRVAVGCMLRPMDWAGQLRQALQRADEVIALTGSDPLFAFDLFHFSPYLWLRVFRGSMLVLLGRPRDGLRDMEDAAGLADRLPLGVTRVVVQTYYAEACSWAGDVAPALHHAHLAIETAERSGSQGFRMMAYGALGAALVLNAEWNEARRALDDARVIARDFRLSMGPMLPALADAYLGLGDAVRARATADEAVAIGRQMRSPITECRGQIALARVVLRTAGVDGREATETALARAAALAEQMEARLFEPDILALRGELAQVCGDADGRVRALREAQRLYVEMGLVERAEKISAELGAASPRTEGE